jgi:hypothetical protein
MNQFGQLIGGKPGLFAKLHHILDGQTFLDAIRHGRVVV